jgi:GGDEF domain-containing protein
MRSKTLDDNAVQDPTTGFGSRASLFGDLARALEADAPPSLLAVFAFAGIEEYRRLFGRIAAEALLTELAGRLEHTRSAVTWYRPREDEFVALVRAPLSTGEDILDGARSALHEAGEFVTVSAVVGAVALPEAASEPMEALILADQELSVRSTAGRARERRSNPR